MDTHPSLLTDVFPYGDSDFTVSKWAFGKATLLKIDHVEIVVAFEVVSTALKNIKVEIHAIEHKACSRKQGHVCDFSEKRQINVKKGQKYLKIWAKMFKIWKCFEKVEVIACYYSMQ